MSIYTENVAGINIDCLPTSLKYLYTTDADSVLSLNPESQRMWFHVIYDGHQKLLDITYPILWDTSYMHDDSYVVIGTKVVSGKRYNILVNPKFYQPRSNAKSAKNNNIQ